MTLPDPAEEATEQIIDVFVDRWSIDQQNGWDEFGGETFADVKRHVKEAMRQAILATTAVVTATRESGIGQGLFQQTPGTLLGTKEFYTKRYEGTPSPKEAYEDADDWCMDR